MNILFFIPILFINFVNGIAIRQYSDDSCSQLSRIDYLYKTNCYSFVSTGSYLIKSCNCTMIEYNLYDGALCLGNLISTFYGQQNTCLSTRQIISCYEEKSSSNYTINNLIFIILLNLFY